MADFQGQWPYTPESEALVRQRQPGTEGIWSPDQYMNLGEILNTLVPMFTEQRTGTKEWQSPATGIEAMMWALPFLSKLSAPTASVAKAAESGVKVPSLLDILKSERGSISNKPLEGHHTLPIGGAKQMENVDWHLKNLGEGWKTIQDVTKEAHKELTKKQLAKISKSLEPIPKETRDKILSSLITTPERAELLDPYRRKLLEDVLGTLPKGTKAHLFGSVVSDKPNPKDIDVLIEYLRGKDWWDVSKHPEKLPVIPKVDLTPSPPLERVPSNMKKIMETGKAKYGPNYDLIRILSVLGALPLGSLIEQENK